VHLQDALGLIAFELLSVQPLLAWAFQPLPGVQGSLEPTILDAGFTPLESLEFIFRGGDWGQGMGTTGHRDLGDRANTDFIHLWGWEEGIRWVTQGRGGRAHFKR